MAPDNSTPNLHAAAFFKVSVASLESLRKMYLPLITDGGLFIPKASRLPNLGTEVFLLLDLPDSQQDLATTGRVVYLSPDNATSTAGFALQLDTQPGDRKFSELIEELLGPRLSDPRPGFVL